MGERISAMDECLIGFTSIIGIYVSLGFL